MSKRLVWHVGAHKCATTSLQLALARAIPPGGDTLYIAPKDKHPIIEDLRRYVWGVQPTFDIDAIVELASSFQGNNIILSEENLIGRMPGLSFEFYPHAHRLRQIIDQLAEKYETIVLLQSREMSRFLSSCYKFRVAHGLASDYAAFLQSMRLDTFKWLNLGRVLFDGAKFEYSILPIEELKNEQAVFEFCHKAVPGINISVLPKINESAPTLLRSLSLLFSYLGRPITPVQLNMIQKHMETSGKNLRQAASLVDIDVSTDMAKLARRMSATQAGSSLDTLLAEYFSDDYERFLERYCSRAALETLG